MARKVDSDLFVVCGRVLIVVLDGFVGEAGAALILAQ